MQLVMSISALVVNNVRCTKKTDAKPRVGWKKPPEGIYMVNIDASFNHERYEATLSVAIMDLPGGFIVARASSLM